MNNSRQADYLVIGQGISGTFLSYYLQKAGKKVLVIDESGPFTSSKIASGVINPVTGRRLVRTWMIEELMPFAVNAYQTLGNELQFSFISQCNILDFHPSAQMQLAFTERLQEEKEYLRLPGHPEKWRAYFNYPFGIGETHPCWLIDLNTLLSEWRKKLQKEGSLLEEKFDHASLINHQKHIEYKNIKAGKIIFCDGAKGVGNPYFNLLPYAVNKGEVIIAKIPGLPRTHIFKQGISIVPWKESLFWIGSSYERNFTNKNPSAAFRNKVENQLRKWLQLPYAITDHWAAERPANMERRPFVGLHPTIQTVGIFNGMGTKGCSLAPYFANRFTQFLINNIPIHPHADVQRFTKILGRKK